jgi:hypothetical protein
MRIRRWDRPSGSRSAHRIDPEDALMSRAVQVRHSGGWFARHGQQRRTDADPPVLPLPHDPYSNSA